MPRTPPQRAHPARKFRLPRQDGSCYPSPIAPFRCGCPETRSVTIVTMFPFFRKPATPPAEPDKRYHFDQNYKVDPKAFLTDVLNCDAFKTFLQTELGGARVSSVEDSYSCHFVVTLAVPRYEHPVVLYVGVIPTSFFMGIAISVLRDDNPWCRTKLSVDGRAHTWDLAGAIDAFRSIFQAIENEAGK